MRSLSQPRSCFLLSSSSLLDPPHPRLLLARLQLLLTRLQLLVIQLALQLLALGHLPHRLVEVVLVDRVAVVLDGEEAAAMC